MSNRIKNIYIPKLRFKGFNDEYNKIKLCDVLFYEQPTKYIVKSDEYNDSFDTPVLTANKSFVLGKTDEKTGIYSKGPVIIFDDFTTDNKYVDFDFKVKSSAIKLLTTNSKNNLFYLYQLININPFAINGHNRHWIRFSSQEIKWICSLEEQEKIAKFFSLLDQQISLLENKLQLIEQKLKYFINKLLKTYNGFPKIRFKGFNDIWMNDYIKNIFTITRGLVIAKNKIIKEGNEKFCYPVYSSQTENNGLMGYYNEYLYENAITWTTDGAKAGTVNYRNQKFYCSNVCGVLLEKEYKPNLCLSLIIQRESKKYVVKDLGNPKLMNNVMAKIKIHFPNQIEEQEKISHFLNLFKIQQKLINNQLAKIKQKKEYFLKSMFINSVQKGGGNYDRNSF